MDRRAFERLDDFDRHGSVAPLVTVRAKLFASAYALFSGMIFLSAIGLVLAPVFHRIMHKFHIDEEAR